MLYSYNMKMHTLLLFILMLFITTACPGSRVKSNKKILQENNMNFPGIEETSFENITHILPEMFTDAYDSYYLISDKYDSYICYDLSVRLSVELFDTDQIETIQYTFDYETTPLNAVHDNYIIQRQNSLTDFSTSIKKEIPDSTNQIGFIQIIHEEPSEGRAESTYYLATLDIDDEIYVFQMIGKRANMGYLYDDFLRIIASVR